VVGIRCDRNRIDGAGMMGPYFYEAISIERDRFTPLAGISGWVVDWYIYFIYNWFLPRRHGIKNAY
jgi:hypothetical protein